MTSLNLFQAIAAHCPNLDSLNLTRCQKLPADSLKIIADGCKLLQDIDLTATKVSIVPRNQLYLSSITSFYPKRTQTGCLDVGESRGNSLKLFRDYMYSLKLTKHRRWHTYLMVYLHFSPV